MNKKYVAQHGKKHWSESRFASLTARIKPTNGG